MFEAYRTEKAANSEGFGLMDFSGFVRCVLTAHVVFVAVFVPSSVFFFANPALTGCSECCFFLELAGLNTAF